MRIPTLEEVIDYVNFYYYSKPMSVVNIKTLQIPYPVSLTKLEADDDYEFQTRISHGLPHVLSAMELIDEIHKTYIEHVDNYENHFDQIAEVFEIDPQDLLELIKIAVVFHDTARQGDGIDLWDEESADECKKYLMEQCQINEKLANFIADTIRYKDNPVEKGIVKPLFDYKYGYKSNVSSSNQKYDRGVNPNFIHLKADLIREVVNMADALEVIRTRDLFKPELLPIAQHESVTPKIMVEDIIPNLVVPHRNKIIEEGRLSKEGKIKYSRDGSTFEDVYRPKPGKDFKKIANSYRDKCEHYDSVILDINENNLEKVFARAFRGITEYQKEHKESGIQWTHNGFFSPRYHGATGKNRAKYFADILNPATSEASKGEKIKALFALMTSRDGQTLQETVLRSFNQTNHKIVLAQVKEAVKKLNTNESLQDINKDVQDHIFKGQGIR
ncbi:MAG: hypothetical protein H0U73_05990 [Tatlockia sp.]|nr:hypothetical protein [Tatlockia sp.]